MHNTSIAVNKLLLRQAIILCSCAALCAWGMAVWSVPVLRESAAMLRDARTTVVAAHDTLAISALREQYLRRAERLRHAIHAYTVVAQPPRDLPTLSQLVYNSAWVAAGKDIVVHKIDPATTENGNASVTLLLSVTCGFNDLQRFVYQLESNPLVFRVMGIAVTPGPERLSVNIALSANLKAL